MACSNLKAATQDGREDGIRPSRQEEKESRRRRFLQGFEEGVGRRFFHPVRLMHQGDFRSPLIGTAVEFADQGPCFVDRDDSHLAAWPQMEQVGMLDGFFWHEEGFAGKFAGLAFQLLEVVAVKEQGMVEVSFGQSLTKLIKGRGCCCFGHLENRFQSSEKNRE